MSEHGMMFESVSFHKNNLCILKIYIDFYWYRPALA